MECVHRFAGIICSMLLPIIFFYTPAQANPEKVVIKTADDYSITGTFTKAEGKTGVVLLHMYRHDKESWLPLVEQLTMSKISSLAIDMRGHGESRMNPEKTDDSKRVPDKDTKLFLQMHNDAEASVRYLEDHGIESGRVALIGASVGCSVAIHTVAKNKVQVKAVVLMTPGTDYLGMLTMTHIKKWRDEPLLILTSREEEDRGAKALYEMRKKRGAELRVFHSEDIHGTNMLDDVDGVEELIADWLADRL